jgi:hypothetical protein
MTPRVGVKTALAMERAFHFFGADFKRRRLREHEFFHGRRT